MVCFIEIKEFTLYKVISMPTRLEMSMIEAPP